MVTKRKQNNQPNTLECSGQDCHWSAPAGATTGPKGEPRDPICEAGTGGCSPAHILEAEESSFHPQQLVEATLKIRRILAKIPADPAGRKLSFCHTKMGTLLAFVKHGGKATGRRVTAKDDNATVAKALKLKGVAAGGA
jgi:hypothetical protein